MLKISMAAAALAAAALTATTPAVALDRNVVIINNTSYTIVEFYASSVGVDDWEEDILGTDTLVSGQIVNIDIDDGTGYCKYDFKAVFEDGDEVIKKGVNVCEISSFTFND